MIFMNFFSRSSRATGPNTRVPIGSFSLLIEDRGVRVEADVAAVAAALLADRPDDDGLDDLPLLDRVRRVRVRLPHRAGDDVAEAAVAPVEPP